MKTREIKQRDLAALTESLAGSNSAMVVSFTKLTVTKDQEFRRSVREAGANYQVVKNTLARIAVKGTQFEDATEHFKGVTAIAWTSNDPVVLTKAISKFMKDNADIYSFKTGVVDGQLIDLKQLTTIANLPSKNELISKLLWVLNSSAQRIVTVINAVPRDLAVVIKQIGENKPAGAAEAEAEQPAAEVKADEAAPAPAETEAAPVDVPAVEATPAAEAPAPGPEAASEQAANAPDVRSETVAEPTEADAPETEAAAEVAADAPADQAEAVPETLEAPTAVQTEAAAEQIADEPDVAAEDILELPPEAEG